MRRAETTCWTMIRGAAAGRDADRRAFAERYVGAVRTYLAARWEGTHLAEEMDDAVQEVFVESFRPGGALARLDPARDGGFRAFFYGVVRNVARRFESRRADRLRRRAGGDSVIALMEERDEQLSRVFDRAWAKAVMREAAERQRALAEERGDSAQQRLELLRLRFHEGLPIREIARLWQTDATSLHREYAKARREFREALEHVVTEQNPEPRADIERECNELLRSLG